MRTNLPENDRINFSHRVEAQLGQAMSSLFVESNSLDNMAVVKSGIFDNDSVEGKHLLNVIETICNWVVSSFNSKLAFSLSDFITLLPYVSLTFSLLATESNPVELLVVSSAVHQSTGAGWSTEGHH